MEISEKDRRLRIKLAAILGTCFLAASIFFLVYGYNQVADAVKSYNWPGTKGKIVSSTIDSSGNHSDGTSYYPNVEYVYSVNGQSYVGNKLQFIQDGVFDKSWAQSKVKLYPVNAVVEVSYNPKDPKQSVLEPGGEMRWYLFVSGAAIAFVLVFAFLAFFLYKDVRKMIRLGQV